MRLNENLSEFHDAQKNANYFMVFGSTPFTRMKGYIAAHHLQFDARLAVIPDSDFIDICIRAVHNFDIDRNHVIKVDKNGRIIDCSDPHAELAADLEEMIGRRCDEYSRAQENKSLLDWVTRGQKSTGKDGHTK